MKLDWNQALTLASPHSYALVSTVSESGRPNLMGLSWWTFTCWKPPMLAISVGEPRFTLECLDYCPEFVLCLPAVDQAKGAWLCGEVSGRDHDKFREGGFEPVESSKVRPPRVQGCTVAFECKVVNRVQSGDHVVLIAEVVAMHGEPDRKMHLYTIRYDDVVGIDCEMGMRKGVPVDG
jgi:flavin reductase (DIM6/NTAB) family NADH-FMN oxidoreductase RutF